MTSSDTGRSACARAAPLAVGRPARRGRLSTPSRVSRSSSGAVSTAISRATGVPRSVTTTSSPRRTRSIHSASSARNVLTATSMQTNVQQKPPTVVQKSGRRACRGTAYPGVVHGRVSRCVLLAPPSAAETPASDEDSARRSCCRGLMRRSRDAVATTRPTTSAVSLVCDLRVHHSEQRFRGSLPEDARRAHAGAAQPRQASGKRKRLIRRSTQGRRSAHSTDNPCPPVLFAYSWNRSIEAPQRPLPGLQATEPAARASARSRRPVELGHLLMR